MQTFSFVTVGFSMIFRTRTFFRKIRKCPEMLNRVFTVTLGFSVFLNLGTLGSVAELGLRAIVTSSAVCEADSDELLALLSLCLSVYLCAHLEANLFL